MNPCTIDDCRDASGDTWRELCRLASLGASRLPLTWDPPGLRRIKLGVLRGPPSNVRAHTGTSVYLGLRCFCFGGCPGADGVVGVVILGGVVAMAES